MESNNLRAAFSSQQHRTFAANAQKEEDAEAQGNVPPTWTDNNIIQMDDNQDAFPAQHDSGDDHRSLDGGIDDGHQRKKSVDPHAEEGFQSVETRQPLAVDTNEAPKPAPVNENAFLRFQLIPISETPGKAAIGEVLERKIKTGQTIKIGRQIVRDGQTTVKGNKKATEIDIWFTSKVVSRLHAEIWTKDGQLCIKDVGSSSGTFLNKMRLSPSGKESRPYPLKQGDVLQFGVDFKGKSETPIEFNEDAPTPSSQAPASRRGSNANVKPPGKRMSIIQGLGMLGMRPHQDASPTSSSATPAPPQPANAATEAGGANLQRKVSKKRTFSMKIQNFLGRKENADGVPHFDENEDPGRNPAANVPRTSHVLPGEQAPAEIPGSSHGQQRDENNNLVNAEN
ncbi:hypothetical protein HK103_003737 [Boothiomyces macroporosus]|uniref:FHA domain-containing protein n=1 Tax=Boothiomyces macroporosus TaxID=261099 RepID=A0AAD5UJW3_9FUNG|nr:hypothetical protein HK103_003737 [Boothiomyces macroporosus]